MTCKLELGAWKRQKDKRNDHRPTMPVNFENQLQSPVGSAKSINPRCCEWDSKIVSKYTCCILEVAGTILNYVCHDEVRLPSWPLCSTLLSSEQHESLSTLSTVYFPSPPLSILLSRSPTAEQTAELLLSRAPQ